uniref:Interleukin-4 receptor alpha N-terminal domain-containing protein n=1 Tax=Latimeria chalumnae TaxID=7897 RepID=H2ZSX9_LATCH
VHNIFPKKSTMWSLVFLKFFLYTATAGSQIGHLKCYNDYFHEMVCSWKVGLHVNCTSEFTLYFQRLLFPLPYNSCVPVNHNENGRLHCMCKIKIPQTVVNDNYSIEVHSNGSMLLKHSVIPAKTVKPRVPVSVSIHETKSKNFNLSWENNYPEEHFLQGYLMYEISYQKKGDPEQHTYTHIYMQLTHYEILRSVLTTECDYVA